MLAGYMRVSSADDRQTDPAKKGVLGAAVVGGVAAGLAGHLGRIEADKILGVGEGHKMAEQTASRVEAVVQTAVNVCKSASEKEGACH